MALPVEIEPSVLWGLTPAGSLPIASGGTLHSGHIHSAHDGRRLLHTVLGLTAYYIQVESARETPWNVGRVYSQETPSYGMDCNQGGAAAEATKRLAATKSVLKDFLDVYLGVLSVSSGPLAIAITGMDILVKTGDLKRNYSAYCDALEAIVDEGFLLQKQMPIFYEHLIGEMLLGRIEKDMTDTLKKSLANAVPGKKIAGAIVGVFLGKVGEDALARNLGGLKKIINEVLLKVADHVITKRETLSEEQVEKLAFHHVAPIYKDATRLPLKMDRAHEIIRETARHAQSVRPRLQKISKALTGLYG